MEETLSFAKNDAGEFETEFSATEIVGVHIERPTTGALYIEHRLSADGTYFCDRSYGVNGPLVFDSWLQSDGYAEGMTTHWRIRSRIPIKSAVKISKD